MTYAAESQALDAEILGVIAAWHQDDRSLDDAGFNALALRTLAYQLKYNAPYARYCARLGVTPESMPQSWQHIPAVPAPAFKEAVLCTFQPSAAVLTFETSGTTAGGRGRHYFQTAALYDAALIAAFDRFVLPDGAALRYLCCVPDPRESRHSSLGYMMDRIARERGDGRTRWYLRDGELFVDELLRDVRAAGAQGQPVCLAATAFAFAHVTGTMLASGIRVALPRGSRLVETGGFKGRARTLDRDELYARLRECFAVENAQIISEYGMTELTSQYYDGTDRSMPAQARRKIGPPWVRARVVGPDRTTLSPGETGSLIHVDLANRASCIAIQTEDLGVQCDAGFVLLGRGTDAEPRGCSLGVESFGATGGAET